MAQSQKHPQSVEAFDYRRCWNASPTKQEIRQQPPSGNKPVQSVFSRPIPAAEQEFENSLFLRGPHVDRNPVTQFEIRSAQAPAGYRWIRPPDRGRAELKKLGPGRWCGPVEIKPAKS